MVKALPHVRPVADIIPGFRVDTWHGIHVPARTPNEIVSRINDVFNRLMARDDVRNKIEALSGVTAAGTPAAYGAFIRDEVTRWGHLVRDAGLRQ